MELKTLLIALLVIALIAIPSLAFAQEDTELEDPGILPGNPFYGFKLFGERVRMILTFNRAAKIKVNLKLAEKRLAEAEKMALKNKTQIVNRLMARYQEHVQEAEQDRERLRMRNITTDDVDAWMNRTTNKHIYVLRRVIEGAPEAAKSGLQNALQRAETNREKIRERLVAKIEERIRRRTTTTTQQTTTTTQGQGEQQGNQTEVNETGQPSGNQTETNETQGQQKGRTLTTLVPI